MSEPRKVVISRKDWDRVLREAVLDDSKVRVSLRGRPRVTTKATPGALGTPRKVVISREDRDRALREAVRDDSKVRVSLRGIRRAGPA